MKSLPASLCFIISNTSSRCIEAGLRFWGAGYAAYQGAEEPVEFTVAIGKVAIE